MTEQCRHVPGPTLSLPLFFLLFFSFAIIDASDLYKNKSGLEIHRNRIGRSNSFYIINAC